MRRGGWARNSIEKSPFCVGMDPLSKSISENKCKELRLSIEHLKERIVGVKTALESELEATKTLKIELKRLRDSLREAKVNSSLTRQQNKHIATMYGPGWTDRLSVVTVNKKPKAQPSNSEMKQKQ